MFIFFCRIEPSIGVIYTGDAGDMSSPLFEMANFVPTTPHIAVGHPMFYFFYLKKVSPPLFKTK